LDGTPKGLIAGKKVTFRTAWQLEPLVIVALREYAAAAVLSRSKSQMAAMAADPEIQADLRHHRQGVFPRGFGRPEA
jgi:hypothetical protein